MSEDEKQVTCPVCHEEIYHANITRDIDTTVVSLDKTIESYK